MPLMEADYDVTHMAFNAENTQFDSEMDKKLHVRFMQHPHFNDTKSRDEGRPIFEMADYIQIMVPGDKDNIIIRPVRPEDIDRFATQYHKYKNNQSQAQGTPLSEWAQVNRAQVEELKYFNVHTIEQLAGMADSNAQKFLGIYALREKARKHLELLKESAPLDHLQAELTKRDETISALTERLESLEEQIRDNEE